MLFFRILHICTACSTLVQRRCLNAQSAKKSLRRGFVAFPHLALHNGRTRFAPTEHHVFDGIATCNFRKSLIRHFCPKGAKMPPSPKGRLSPMSCHNDTAHKASGGLQGGNALLRIPLFKVPHYHQPTQYRSLSDIERGFGGNEVSQFPPTLLVTFGDKSNIAN